MTGPRFLRWILAIALLPTSGWAQKGSTESQVSLTPAVVVAGSPELIRVHAPGATEVSGEWLGRKVEFFETERKGEWKALAGVDVEAPVGPSTLRITARINDKAEDLSRTPDVHPAHYRTETMSVAPRFVEPDPEQLKRIHAEGELKAKIFGASAAEPLWHGDFRRPVSAPATDSFGMRRLFNGKLGSIHKGADFHAHVGTPVHAANSGLVVLARPLYYEGNCVIIDHGLGLFTESMHFSRIDVKEGQHVDTGDVLGLSGATGRVTGPHLHWAVRWEGAFLDPIKLLKLNLASAQSQPPAHTPHRHVHTAR